MSFNRRDFLKILGVSPPSLYAPDLLAKARYLVNKNHPFGLKGISPDFTDQLKLSQGLRWDLLISEGSSIGNGLKFGCNNDYLQFFTLSKNNRGILWVNHEYFHPLLHSTPERNKTNVENEKKLVGGSLIEIKFNGNKWEFIESSTFNRRLDASTIIPFAWHEPIANSINTRGTFANCAGGKTPWDTLLTCEENYDLFVGEIDRKTGKKSKSTLYGWEDFVDYPPEHYGWVVEVEPKTGSAQKLVGLGRFAHECATVKLSASGLPVVYMGDDANDECLYKFISSERSSLKKGTLYVANFDKKEWIPLIINHPLLKTHFKSQTEILINCREAAKLVGGTPLDRPEDIEVDPSSGHVLVACTNNKPAGRPYGKILKIKEKNQTPLAMKFEFETFLEGGEKGGFACPDNMAFDRKGNLWFTTDMKGSDMHTGKLNNFGNNGLFVVLKDGPSKGIPIQIASAPIDAEFIGPLFSPDYKTLFLSVQHPGEETRDLKKLTSVWPNGKFPKASVITLSGPLLEKINGV